MIKSNNFCNIDSLNTHLECIKINRIRTYLNTHIYLTCQVRTIPLSCQFWGRNNTFLTLRERIFFYLIFWFVFSLFPPLMLFSSTLAYSVLTQIIICFVHCNRCWRNSGNQRGAAPWHQHQTSIGDKNIEVGWLLPQTWNIGYCGTYKISFWL